MSSFDLKEQNTFNAESERADEMDVSWKKERKQHPKILVLNNRNKAKTTWVRQFIHFYLYTFILYCFFSTWFSLMSVLAFHNWKVYLLMKPIVSQWTHHVFISVFILTFIQTDLETDVMSCFDLKDENAFSAARERPAKTDVHWKKDRKGLSKSLVPNKRN